MILIDFNGVVMGEINRTKDPLDEFHVRTLILNQLRIYAHKFKRDYGKMVICCEGRSWRKEVFPNYKFKRQSDRDKSNIDWDFVYGMINTVTEEIRESLPYQVIQHPRAEADDIIATLAEMTQDFGRHEDVMIVSSDGDFKQLHCFDNVKQFSPYHQKVIREEKPRQFMLETILKGQRKDGVPNVLSPDNSFVDGIRQKPVRQTFIDKLVEAANPLGELSDEERQHFFRNAKLLDLTKCPADIKTDIIDQFDNNAVPPRRLLMDYLMKQRLRLLLECIEDF